MIRQNTLTLCDNISTSGATGWGPGPYTSREMRVLHLCINTIRQQFGSKSMSEELLYYEIEYQDILSYYTILHILPTISFL